MADLMPLLLILLCPCPFVLTAPDNQGTEFIIGFMQNEKIRKSHRATPMEVILATPSAQPVTVTVILPLHDPGFEVKVTVQRGVTRSVSIPPTIRGKDTQISDKGVLVRAEGGEVSVYAVNKEPKSTDAFVALPTDVLGTEYYAVTYTEKPTLMVVATQEQTQVNVTCPETNPGCRIRYKGVTYRDGRPLSVVLDRFQTFHALGEGKDADFTGAHVTSDKPISMFSGNKKGRRYDGWCLSSGTTAYGSGPAGAVASDYKVAVHLGTMSASAGPLRSKSTPSSAQCPRRPVPFGRIRRPLRPKLMTSSAETYVLFGR